MRGAWCGASLPLSKVGSYTVFACFSYSAPGQQVLGDMGRRVAWACVGGSVCAKGQEGAPENTATESLVQSAKNTYPLLKPAGSGPAVEYAELFLASARRG